MLEALQVALTVAHIGGGVTALGAGAAALLLRKGGGGHKRWGRVYFWAMFIIFVTALGMLSFRPNIFMLNISVLSFYSALSGYRAIKRKAAGGAAAPLDWMSAALALLSGLGFMLWGGLMLAGVLGGDLPEAFAILGLIFGGGLAKDAGSDLRSFRRTPQDRRWWFFFHLERMASSYIAAITAFAVQNLGPRLPLELSWIVWVSPAIIGTTMIVYWTGVYRRRFSGKAGEGRLDGQLPPI